ncbi:MAG: hypothetical protein IID41_09020 [Planctomycetes bacterium]|nr:hypothetical protein [Planctomycetota bacterium]
MDSLYEEQRKKLAAVTADRNRLREALIGLLGIINSDDDDDHVRRVSRGADCECWPCQAAALAGAGDASDT